MLRPPTNYTGSKHLLMNQLLEYFPEKETVDTFYDVFTGGLSVSLNSPYENIVSNDIITPLIEFYKILKTAADDNTISKELTKILSYKIDKNSKDEFVEKRKLFNETKSPYLLFALISSCTNNMMRFNRKYEFNQTFGERTMNDNTLEKLEKYMLRMQSKKISFNSCDFYELLTKKFTPTEKDFVYLDPPYLISEAGYNAIWTKQHQDNLNAVMELLDANKVRFIMSNVIVHKNEVLEIPKSFEKWKVIGLDGDYEKVARNKKEGKTKEVIVTNFEIEKPKKQILF